MDPRLIMMSTFYTFGIILTLSLAIFVWIKSRKNTLSVLFCLISLAVAIVEISILGIINATNLDSAYSISLLNVANIYIVVFTAHWVLEAIGKTKQRQLALAAIHLSALFLNVYFMYDPQSFLALPTPKMYFNFYFEPGYLYGLMRVYFAVITFYFLAELIIAYRSTIDKLIRNRLRYVIFGIVYGMIFGHFAVFLVYNIEIDPVYSILFPLYTIPLAYSIIRYELMDTQIVAKRALVYAITVSVVAVLLDLINIFKEILLDNFDFIPGWLIPVITSVIASSAGFVIWSRVKDAEILKNEFITIVTHKFRTPLTQIKWTLDSIKTDASKSPEVTEALNTIMVASESLSELTNTLLKATASESADSSKILTKEYIPDIVAKTVRKFKKELSNKDIDLHTTTSDDIPMTPTDGSNLAIVLYYVIENAIRYTNKSGRIDIDIKNTSKYIKIVVKDSGIGMSKPELSRVFSMFYRSESSMRIDTEGLGISLFIAKQISDRNGWTLSVHSEGENMGSLFTLTIPIRQE
jgi:signal transduction histidine kinase